MAASKVQQISSILPEAFLERLRKILPKEYFESGLETFSCDKLISVRINTLKAQGDQVLGRFQKDGIQYSTVSWFDPVLIIRGAMAKEISSHPMVEEGLLYIQSLSSMLPVLALKPQPKDMVLDMCAAPGSKTTLIAALMKNEGTIVCIESVRNRYYKLKAATEKMGVHITNLKLIDGRKYRVKNQLFDKILVDASCSSEGRFKTFQKKTFRYWSLRKIKEMVRKQKGLVLNASRYLKPGGTLVYSTCTFAPEENEGVVDWLLRKTDGALQVEPLNFEGIASYPAIRKWGEKVYSDEVKRCFRVLPTQEMEGFFVAKFRRREF